MEQLRSCKVSPSAPSSRVNKQTIQRSRQRTGEATSGEEIRSRPRYSHVLAVAPTPSTCSSSRTATLPPSRTASLSVAVPLTTKRSVLLLGTMDGATAAHAVGAGAAVVGAAVGPSHAMQASARASAERRHGATAAGRMGRRGRSERRVCSRILEGTLGVF